MRSRIVRSTLVAAVAWLPFSTGCEKQPAASKPASEMKPADKPAAPVATPPASAPTKPAEPSAPASISAPAAAGDGPALDLDGLTFTVPEGWNKADPGSGMFSALAAFSLARADGDAEDVSVRITHYPEQKGKDDLNIARWLSQVTRPDGTAYTKDNADIKVSESGNVRLTVVDLPGAVATGMMGGGEAKPEQRMIAAIVDHPKGPHFVRVLGGAASVEKWAASVDAFVKSATTK